MKQGDVLKSKHLKRGEHELFLDKIYPIEEVTGAYSFELFIDEKKQTKYANKVKVTLKEEREVSVILGLGYYAVPLKDLDHQFYNNNGWSGGDGIFSFNLTNGKDNMDLKEDVNTLFIFSDTFVGWSDPVTHQRMQPHAMPNNSFAYYKDGKLDFHVNKDSNGAVDAFYHLNKEFDYDGSIPKQLLSHNFSSSFGYVSGYGDKTPELLFDFFTVRPFDKIEIQNYFNPEVNNSYLRGVKEFVILKSDDNKTFEEVVNYNLKENENGSLYEELKVDFKARYVKFILKTNYNNEIFNDGTFGLNKVNFYYQKQLYKDINATSSSVMLRTALNSWLWLQDGVVIGNKHYFIPLVVNNDLSQPEGLQFKITDTALIETEIKDGKLDFSKVTQKVAPILAKKDGSEYIFGGAIFSNTKTANSLNPDGYIYVYGYKTTYGLRQMLVARVKEEEFNLFDSWQYYTKSGWSYEITDAEPLLDHISPEFSVSEIREGVNKGKVIANFTYETNTKEIAFSIGESLLGPFAKSEVIYLTPEQDLFKSTTYTYNSKAHPHLSTSKEILVTYNTNTYNFDHNMSDYRVYKPRFIKMVSTE